MGKLDGVTARLSDLPEDERQAQFLGWFLPEQSSIRAFIRSAVWDRSRCDDLFQEVALVLWRELDRYDPQRSFGAWARGVAANTVLKSLRDARRTPVALSPQAIQALEAAFQDLASRETKTSPSTRQEALRRCLERLPDRARSLVRLRYGDSLKVADIASRVMSSPDAVQKALSRLRESLQRCVERQLRAA